MGGPIGHSPRSRRLLQALLVALVVALTVGALEIATRGRAAGESTIPTVPTVPRTTVIPASTVGSTSTVVPTITGPASTTSPATSATAPALPAPALKPVLGGLLDRNEAPPAEFRSAVDGFVVSVPWAVLQPAADAPLADGNPIDKAIAVAHAEGLKLKLRVTAGVDAPDWAKHLGGDPVEVADYYGRQGTVGRFWSEQFGAAYRQLQRELAARYDDVPEVVQTQITRCTTMFAEPFLRQGRSPGTIRSLLEAGYSNLADEICQREQVDAHEVWRRTRSGLSFNPYQHVSGDGGVTPDETFTEEMMVYCRHVLEARCVLENHSIRTTGQGRCYQDMYEAMRVLGGAIGFQTAAPSRVGSLTGTLVWAVEQGASSVELPVSYRTDSSPAALAPIDQRLEDIAGRMS